MLERNLKIQKKKKIMLYRLSCRSLLVSWKWKSRRYIFI